MDGQTSILLTLALILCIVLLGPGLISIEDTQVAEPEQPEASEDTPLPD